MCALTHAGAHTMYQEALDVYATLASLTRKGTPALLFDRGKKLHNLVKKKTVKRAYMS